MELRDKLKELTDEELFAAYQKEKQLEIKQELTLRYLYLAKSIAIEMNKLYSHFMQVDDVVNEGAIAIMKGIDRFDPDKGIKFSTFISRRIRGMIFDLVREKDMMPRTYHKRKKTMDEAIRHLTKERGRPPTDEELAEFMQMNLKRCKTLLQRVKMYEAVSLDSPVDDGKEDLVMQIASEDSSTQPEESYIRNEVVQILEEAVNQLGDNLKTVISLYYVEGLTMHQISQVLQVSDSRVSQMHKTAIQKLRKSVKDQLD